MKITFKLEENLQQSLLNTLQDIWPETKTCAAPNVSEDYIVLGSWQLGKAAQTLDIVTKAPDLVLHGNGTLSSTVEQLTLLYNFCTGNNQSISASMQDIQSPETFKSLLLTLSEANEAKAA